MEAAAGRSRASASTSLGRASTFLVHHPHTNSGRGVPSTRIVRPSVSPSPSWPPVPSTAAGAAGPSPRLSEDVSRLPLDLLEPAATRWASTAGRASRTAPRVRSTLGPQSDVVDTGVFVCPDTVVGALYTTAGGREDLVVTAECAGWLRVREQRTGVIRHQQQLRDGNETSCLAWASAATATDATTASGRALQTVVTVGQLSGLISFYALVGESLVELPTATCVFHEAPILSCVPLNLPWSATPTPAVAGAAVPPTLSQQQQQQQRRGQRCLLTVDTDGVAALWSLSASTRAKGAAVALSVQLLHCSYATPPAPVSPRLAGGKEAHEEGEDSGGDGGEQRATCAPPVVVSAASVFGVSASCAVVSTHRFTDHPSTRCGDSDEDDASRSCSVYGENAHTLVYLADFGAREDIDAAMHSDFNGTTLAMSSHLSDTTVSASTDGAAAAAAVIPTQVPRYDWEVLCAYSLPEGWRSRAENTRISITALCLVGGGDGDDDGMHALSCPSAQLWAGTMDGRLFIWAAHTGQFVRCLRSSSAAPIHSLTCVPAHGFCKGRGGNRSSSSTINRADPLVWASQADGGVVAWSAVTFAVVEVLPVSYPPPSSSSSSVPQQGEGGGEVVSVRDAVDLLRTTRHFLPAAPSSFSAGHPTASNPPSPWVQRGSGFTLFVQPMEVVCMQRAWSVATDGTVRTWLLPAGNAAALQEEEEGEDNDDNTEKQAEYQQHRGTPENELLDARTVRCFLQDKAEAYAREQQAWQLEWAAQQAQLSALRERNEVLTAALQQAIGRLERVGADGLVRSTSPADTPPPPPHPTSPRSRDSLKTPDVRDAVGADEDGAVDDDSDDDATGQADERAEEESKRERCEEGKAAGQHARSPSQESAASTLSSPSIDSAPCGQLVATASHAAPLDAVHPPPHRRSSSSSGGGSNETQVHVQVLNQLLEELHSKLEESWSRNDDLREELLVYQLRTLEREEDMARRVRETVMREAAVTAAAREDADGDAVAAAHSTVAARELPSSRNERPRAVHNSDAARGSWDAAAPMAAPASPRSQSSFLTSPSRTVEAPTMETLVGTASAESTTVGGSGSHRIVAPNISSALSDRSDRHREGATVSMDYPVDYITNATLLRDSTAAADRFLAAASAALPRNSSHGRSGVAWEGRGAYATDSTQLLAPGSKSSPPRPIRAPLPPEEDAVDDGGNAVDVEECTALEEQSYDDDGPLPQEDGDQQQPALVAAWSTSEGEDLSPISTSTITAPPALQDEISADDSHDRLRRGMSPSFISYPHQPSRHPHANHSSFSVTSLFHGHSSTDIGRHVHASDAPSVRVYSNAGAVYNRPPASTATPRDVTSPGPLPASRVTPVRHALPATAAPSSPRGFRSPIIYHY
jgi:hypothetical protein